MSLMINNLIIYYSNNCNYTQPMCSKNNLNNNPTLSTLMMWPPVITLMCGSRAGKLALLNSTCTHTLPSLTEAMAFERHFMHPFATKPLVNRRFRLLSSSLKLATFCSQLSNLYAHASDNMAIFALNCIFQFSAICLTSDRNS